MGVLRGRVAQDPSTAAARRKARARGDRRAEMSMLERYNDVRDFWARLPAEERRRLLRVPVHSLLESESPAPQAFQLVQS